MLTQEEARIKLLFITLTYCISSNSNNKVNFSEFRVKNCWEIDHAERMWLNVCDTWVGHLLDGALGGLLKVWTWNPMENSFSLQYMLKEEQPWFQSHFETVLSYLTINFLFIYEQPLLAGNYGLLATEIYYWQTLLVCLVSNHSLREEVKERRGQHCLVPLRFNSNLSQFL